MASSGRRRLRVLVADDDVDTAVSTCALLEYLGCATAVAYDGAAALSLLNSFLPHVVMLDIEMPIMSGLDVARTIRTHPSGGHQPRMLIAVTGQSAAAARQQALDAGFDEFVSKPIDTPWLQLNIQRWQSMPPRRQRAAGR